MPRKRKLCPGRARLSPNQLIEKLPRDSETADEFTGCEPPRQNPRTPDDDATSVLESRCARRGIRKIQRRSHWYGIVTVDHKANKVRSVCEIANSKMVWLLPWNSNSRRFDRHWLGCRFTPAVLASRMGGRVISTIISLIQLSDRFRAFVLQVIAATRICFGA